MIFSTPSAYAIRGLCELAAQGGGSLMIERLTADAGLSRTFVAKLFQKLKRAGLLTSTRGRAGGYALARAAHSITLLEIVTVIDGASPVTGCVLGMKECDDAVACPQHDLYKPIRQRLADYLQTTTLADMVASLKTKTARHRTRGAQTADRKENA